MEISKKSASSSQLLFICFINDMPEVVHSSIQMFADDTKIFRTVNNSEQPRTSYASWYHMHKEGVQVNLQTTELEKDLGVYVNIQYAL